MTTIEIVVTLVAALNLALAVIVVGWTARIDAHVRRLEMALDKMRGALYETLRKLAQAAAGGDR